MCFVFSYNKFSRHLSQTPWLVDGKRKSDSSVEELICNPLNVGVMAADWRFSASGREDLDVRMLGTGRPFVVEFINPRRINFTSKKLLELQVINIISSMSVVLCTRDSSCYSANILQLSYIE